MFERLREDIQSVFHRDPAARNAFEVLTCYPGMHAIWIHRLSALLWGAGWKWLARLRRLYGRSSVSRAEMNILRGILTETQKAARGELLKRKD